MKRFIITGIICIVAVLLIHAQSSVGDNGNKTALKVTSLDKNSLSPRIRYSGKVVHAVRWTDKEGEHTIVTTETGQVASKKSEDGRSAALFAYHYVANPDSTSLVWKMADGVKDCPVDVQAAFVKNTFAVTDLNKDGKPEIWMMYKTGCAGDVSPAALKIIMFEGDKKYAARGKTKVQVSEKEFDGGECVYDEAFKKAPTVIRDYATRLWKQNVLEKYN